MNIGVEETSLPLDQLVDAQLAQLYAMGPFQLSSRTEIYVAGLPAQQLEVTGQMGSVVLHGKAEMVPMQWLIIYVLNNNKVFTITYTAEPRAYDKYMPDVQEMLDLLELS